MGGRAAFNRVKKNIVVATTLLLVFLNKRRPSQREAGLREHEVYMFCI